MKVSCMCIAYHTNLNSFFGFVVVKCTHARQNQKMNLNLHGIQYACVKLIVALVCTSLSLFLVSSFHAYSLT